MFYYPTLYEMRAYWDAAPLCMVHAHNSEFSDRIRDRVHPGHLGTVLDWGCGGGAGVVALRGRYDTYYALDIAPRSLRLAAEHFRGGEVPILLSGPPVELALPPVDYVLSTSCFQHFPSREYGLEVVDAMARLLRPGGRGLVQIRVIGDIYRSRVQGHKGGRYLPHMAWTEAGFASHLRAVGLVQEKRELDERDQMWFWFRKEGKR